MERARKPFCMMVISRLTAMIMPGVAALAVSMTGSHARPCAPRIVHPEARIDAGHALSAPQSIAAQMHRQPTVASVAAAEGRLAGIACAMRRARAGPRGR